jgi:hypothetical protein
LSFALAGEMRADEQLVEGRALGQFDVVMMFFEAD